MERDAAPVPESPATESDDDFLARIERLGNDWRFSDEFIGLIVRTRYPRDYNFHVREAEANG